MIRSLTTAATGMAAQQYNLDVISNNLANVNTTGFKSQRAEFQDIIYQTMRGSGTSVDGTVSQPQALQVGLGTRLAATSSDFSEGSIQVTSNPLDLAIIGNGFFQVTGPNGQTMYTRDGSFKTNSQGLLVTSDGYPVAGDLTVPSGATSVSISSGGVVSATVAGQSTPQQVGQIQIVTFPNPGGLVREGNNLFSAGGASGQPTPTTAGQNGAGSIQSGALEGSNVQVVDAMVQMIEAQRAYEINSKAITTSSQMMQTLENLVQ